MDEPEVDESLVAALNALSLNEQTHLYRLPPELISRILAYVAIESGRDFRKCIRAARKFRITPTDSLFWEPLCRNYYSDCSHIRKYKSWHDMFVRRPQLRFNGVYVGRTTYYRQGAVDNGSWNPTLIEVTFYRYIRLWSDGTAQTLLSVKPPEAILPFIHVRGEKVCVGQWRIDEDRNILSLYTDMSLVSHDYVAQLSFKIGSQNGCLHNELQWRHHQVRNKDEMEWDNLPIKGEGSFIFELVVEPEVEAEATDGAEEEAVQEGSVML